MTGSARKSRSTNIPLVADFQINKHLKIYRAVRVTFFNPIHRVSALVARGNVCIGTRNLAVAGNATFTNRFRSLMRLKKQMPKKTADSLSTESKYDRHRLIAHIGCLRRRLRICDKSHTSGCGEKIYSRLSKTEYES